MPRGCRRRAARPRLLLAVPHSAAYGIPHHVLIIHSDKVGPDQRQHEMCGRYTVTVSECKLQQRFVVTSGNGPAEIQLPRYNAAPGQILPIVFMDPDGTRRLIAARWGFPSPMRTKTTLGRPLINARAETVAIKPAFRTAFQSSRCLVPADGFYEWSRTGKTTRSRQSPRWFHLPDARLFAFAGLRAQTDGDNGVTTLFTILTSEARQPVSDVHHRMPVILHPEHESVWLDPATPRFQLEACLKPTLATSLLVQPVSPDINRVSVDRPDCIKSYRDPESTGFLL